jgi:hypothetical protein
MKILHFDMDREGTKEECRLHPLIHTFIKFNLAHNAVGGQPNEVEKNPQQPAHCWLLGAKIGSAKAHSPLSQGHRQERIPVN